MEENKRKRGRPPKNNARRNQFKIKLTDEEAELLEYFSKLTGQSKAEFIRESLERRYETIPQLPNKNSYEYNVFDEYSDEYFDEYGNVIDEDFD